MSYTVALPDGRTVEFPDSVSKEKAAEILREQLGIGGNKPSEDTLIGSATRGFKSMVGSEQTGIASLFDAN